MFDSDQYLFEFLQVMFCGLYSGNIEVWSKRVAAADDDDVDEVLSEKSPKRDRKFRRQATLKNGHSGSVFCLAVNDDLLVSGSFDHSVCVWDRRQRFELLVRLKEQGSI
jgi:WD40 repeat protein